MKTLPILIALLIISQLCAQNIKGIATYKTDRKVDLRMDSTQVDSDMQAQMAAMLRKQFQKEYTLQFNATESLYKENESLAAPAPAAASGGFNIVVSGGSDLLYRNTEENTYVNETEIMSKQFLIKDQLEKPDWKLEKETKNIGNYTAFKATFTREVTEQTFNSANDSLVEVKRDRVTTAWYTLDIPVQHGPAEHWGLPGLILEISEGDLSILCSRIVLNPEKEINIVAPKKGKKVTQAEYDEIQRKKSEEMMEQFHGSGRRGDGNSVQIRIGG